MTLNSPNFFRRASYKYILRPLYSFSLAFRVFTFWSWSCGASAYGYVPIQVTPRASSKTIFSSKTTFHAKWSVSNWIITKLHSFALTTILSGKDLLECRTMTKSNYPCNPLRRLREHPDLATEVPLLPDPLTRKASLQKKGKIPKVPSLLRWLM